MNLTVMVQLLVLLTLAGTIAGAVTEGISFGEFEKGRISGGEMMLTVSNLAAKQRGSFGWLARRNARDQISLEKGTWYLGNSLADSLLYPNYLYIRSRGFYPKTRLLLKVREYEIEVTVLRGKIETLNGEHRKDSRKSMILGRGTCFLIQGLRFEVQMTERRRGQ